MWRFDKAKFLRVFLSKGISAMKLADTANVKTKTIRRAAEGAKLRPQTIYKICTALDVNPMELIKL